MRVRKLLLHPSLLLRFLVQDEIWKIIAGIPNGCRMSGFVIDPSRNSLAMFIEHESFDDIPAHQEAPEHNQIAFESISNLEAYCLSGKAIDPNDTIPIKRFEKMGFEKTCPPHEALDAYDICRKCGLRL